MENWGDLPATSGAYGLIIRLMQPLQFKGHTLIAARYLYAGSAYGPGGMRARIARHFKGGKKAHWHVDRLTNADRVMAAYALPGGSECAIIEAALKIKGVSVPVPGFGGSDCRTCPAHLLRLPDGFKAEAFFSHLAPPA